MYFQISLYIQTGPPRQTSRRMLSGRTPTPVLVRLELNVCLKANVLLQPSGGRRQRPRGHEGWWARQYPTVVVFQAAGPPATHRTQYRQRGRRRGIYESGQRMAAPRIRIMNLRVVGIIIPRVHITSYFTTLNFPPIGHRRQWRGRWTRTVT